MPAPTDGHPAVPFDATGEPFPMTPMQEAYWTGRQHGQTLGGIGCQAYMEFDGERIDPERLNRAIEFLVRRHGMLRARFLPDGRQCIPDAAPGSDLPLTDLRNHTAAAAEEVLPTLREDLSHRPLDVASGEVFAVQLTLLPAGRTRLHCRFDLLVADGRSIQILLGDLVRLYQDPETPLAPVDYDFPRYLRDCGTHLASARTRAEEYWRRKAAELPSGPNLPLAVAPETIVRPRFRRHEHVISARNWQLLSEHAKANGATRAMAVATAYGEVLARWSTNSRFLLNIPHFGRSRIHPRVTEVVGDFSNLVPAVADLAADRNFDEQARHFQRTFRQDMRHGAHHGVKVLRDLQRRNRLQGNPAPVVFTYNVFDAFGDDLVPSAFRRILGRPGYMITQTPQVWLDHQVFQQDGEARLVWDAVDGLFPPSLVDDMFAAEVDLLDRLATSSRLWQAPAALPLPDRQRARRRRLNASAVPFAPGTLHSGFFAHASTAPERPALLWGQDRAMSYGSLAEQALKVARRLREAGVRPGDAVAIHAVKGPEQIIAVLGVLAAAAAYVPLSPAWPAARHTQVLSVSGVRHVLDTLPGTLTWPAAVTAVGLDEALTGPALAAPVPSSPHAAAYVLFTSGSTGTPKGVEMSHKAALNTLAWVNGRCGIGERDRVLALSALEFDLSVYDVFGLLSAGGAVVLPLEEQRRDAAAWWDLLDRHRVTVWNSVPMLLESLLSAAPERTMPDALRAVLLSGDRIAADLPARVQRGRGTRRILAMGGATEAGIWSTFCDAGHIPEDASFIPYGFPLANQRLRVVDARGRDCPDWVPGELWIGGAGLANGYLKDPARTAEQFLEDHGERWYRTGDLVRYRQDGALEILGRIDHQVKVSGVRIELGDVDAALSGHASVATAVTVAVPTGRAGEHRLVSYVLPAADDVPLEAVRAHLAATLPRHYLPARLIVLDELPLTANGKVDRATLTAWATAPASPDAGDTSPPRPGTEAQLAALWGELLGHQVRSRSDEFFMLGGNSILSTRLNSLLRERFGVSLTAREVAAAPRLGDLAALLDERAALSHPSPDES